MTQPGGTMNTCRLLGQRLPLLRALGSQLATKRTFIATRLSRKLTALGQLPARNGFTPTTQPFSTSARRAAAATETAETAPAAATNGLPSGQPSAPTFQASHRPHTRLYVPQAAGSKVFLCAAAAPFLCNRQVVQCCSSDAPCSSRLVCGRGRRLRCCPAAAAPPPSQVPPLCCCCWSPYCAGGDHPTAAVLGFQGLRCLAASQYRGGWCGWVV